jgi:hypothetical protein
MRESREDFPAPDGPMIDKNYPLEAAPLTEFRINLPVLASVRDKPDQVRRYLDWRWTNAYLLMLVFSDWFSDDNNYGQDIWLELIRLLIIKPLLLEFLSFRSLFSSLQPYL